MFQTQQLYINSLTGLSCRPGSPHLSVIQYTLQGKDLLKTKIKSSVINVEIFLLCKKSNHN